MSKPLNIEGKHRLVRALVTLYLKRALGKKKITKRKYGDAIQKLKRERFVEALIENTELENEFDGNRIIEWIRVNWVEILRVILILLPLFI